MPILIACGCGATLRAKDEHAGKRTRCPSCSTVLTVPAAVAVTAAPPPRPSPPPKPAPEEEPLDEVLPADDEDEDESPRPKKKRRLRDEAIKKKSASSGGGFFGPEAAGFNYGIVGGLVMMLIAVVWFVPFALIEVYFIYPPILFIIGIVAVIKGIIDGNVAGKR